MRGASYWKVISRKANQDNVYEQDTVLASQIRGQLSKWTRPFNRMVYVDANGKEATGRPPLGYSVWNNVGEGDFMHEITQLTRFLKHLGTCLIGGRETTIASG